MWPLYTSQLIAATPKFAFLSLWSRFYEVIGNTTSMSGNAGGLNKSTQHHLI